MMPRRAQKALPRWLFLWAAAAIALGVFFRFYNIDRKIYSSDETTTSLHVSGHSLRDYQAHYVDGRVHTAAEFLRFQHVDPQRGPSVVARVLAAEDPEHPPVFYVAEREWMIVAGDSIAARRALSAIASVLAIGAAFWFGLELFERLAPALTFSALVALSPFHVFYAQTVREYEFWTLATLLSSALLARAVRRGEWIAWTAYALLDALALYTDVIFVFVLAGQLALAALLSHLERRRAILPCALAVGCALAMFAPWMRALLDDSRHHSITKNAYTTALPLKFVVLKWAFIVGQTFMDLDYKYQTAAVFLPLIFAGIAFAFAVLIRTTPARVWLHVATLTTATALVLLVWDIVERNTVTTQARYLVPTWLGIECACAFAIAHFAVAGRRRSRAAAVAACAVAALGFASLAVSSQYREWYGGSGADLPQQVDILAGQPHPLILFKDDQPAWDDSPLALSNYLSPDVRFEMIPRNGALLPLKAPNLLTLDSTPQFRTQLERLGYRLVDLYTFAETGALASFRQQGNAIRRQGGYVEYQPSIWRLIARR